MTKRITIQLTGSHSDKEDVRLPDFIKQLQTVLNALRETERDLSGLDEPLLDYKVVGLSHSSPAKVIVEPVPLDNTAPAPSALMKDVVVTFASELQLIKRKGELVLPPDLGRLRAYQDIGLTPKNRIEKITIRSGNRVVTIDEKFKERLNTIVGPDEVAHGTVSGMLEAINIHNTHRFTLYPPIGPKHIAGTFPARLRPKVKEAIGNFVTVIGELRYKIWAPFPHGILADEIDIHEPESELPTMQEVRGAFAGSIGDLNSAEFIDRLRYEDW